MIGYQKTKTSAVDWIGNIPKHWDIQRLRSSTKLITEKASKRDNPIALENIESWTGRLIKTETEFEGDGIAFNAGDILFGKLRPYLAKAYLADLTGEAVGDLLVLRPEKDTNSKFTQYQILNREFISIVNSSTFGSKMPRTSWDFMGNMLVTAPPIDEQEKIVNFLDRETSKIDELIQKQEKLIELSIEKRQAVISHAVTKGINIDAESKESGIEWIGNIPKHWQIGGLTKFIGPVVDYRGKTPTKTHEGMFLVTARNIKNGKINYSASEEFVDAASAESLLARGRPEIGDILFTMEAPLGEVAMIDRVDIALAQRLVKFRGLKNISSNKFLLYWLMSNFCQARLSTLATGSTALGIKSSKLGQIECLLPPYDEQLSIVSYLDAKLSKIDILAIKTCASIKLLKERRSSLISAAVTGKIDVREVA